MIKINGKSYKGKNLVIDKDGNVIIDGVHQGLVPVEPKLSLWDWLKKLFS